MKRMLLIGLVLLSACEALPRDPGDTTGRVMRDRTFTVGFVSPDLANDPRAAALIRTVGGQVHAKPVRVPGTGDDLLTKLEHGGVDLVIGRFRADSPWKTDIAFAPPLDGEPEASDAISLRAAMRNGENKWIMQVEHASRAVSGEGRAQ
jgi:hypothetical protein